MSGHVENPIRMWHFNSLLPVNRRSTAVNDLINNFNHST